MQGNKRVYPRERAEGKWVSYLLLFFSAVLLLSGLVWREDNSGVSIQVSPTLTPVPMDAAFDETMTSREITLPSSTWYALQLGAFENEAAAQELAEQFTRRGAAGYVWHDGRYRTLAAVYTNRDDAQNVRRQLSELHTVDSYLFQIDLPALHVRLSGMAGQLDILEAAFAHAQDLVSNLQAISMMMDRQELNTEETLERLQALSSQVSLVSLRLEQRFLTPRHAAVEGLIDCFGNYAAFANGLTGRDNAVTLGMQVKRQTFSSLDILKSVYDALSNT